EGEALLRRAEVWIGRRAGGEEEGNESDPGCFHPRATQQARGHHRFRRVGSRAGGLLGRSAQAIRLGWRGWSGGAAEPSYESRWAARRASGSSTSAASGGGTAPSSRASASSSVRRAIACLSPARCFSPRSSSESGKTTWR